MKLTSLIAAAFASLALSSDRFFGKMAREADSGSKRYLRHGTHVWYKHSTKKTTTAARLKREAKKRANIRARSPK